MEWHRKRSQDSQRNAVFERYKERAAFYVQTVVFYERKSSMTFAACHARGTFDLVYRRRYIHFHDHLVGMWDITMRREINNTGTVSYPRILEFLS
jgi:hypothetical protein